MSETYGKAQSEYVCEVCEKPCFRMALLNGKWVRIHEKCETARK